MDCSSKVPLYMRLLMQEYWNGLPFPSPGDLPNLGIEPTSPLSPALAGRFFTRSGKFHSGYCFLEVVIFSEMYVHLTRKIDFIRRTHVSSLYNFKMIKCVKLESS